MLELPVEIWCRILKFCTDDAKKNLSQTCHDLYEEQWKEDSKPYTIQGGGRYKVKVYKRYGYEYNCNSTENVVLPCKILSDVDGHVEREYFPACAKRKIPKYIVYHKNGNILEVCWLTEHKGKNMVKEINETEENNLGINCDLGAGGKNNVDTTEGEKIKCGFENKVEEKNETGYITERWSENGNKRVVVNGNMKKVTIYYNGKKQQRFRYIHFLSNNNNSIELLHSYKDKPAKTTWYPNGNKKREVWYVMDEYMRKDSELPSTILYNNDGSIKTKMFMYLRNRGRRARRINDLFYRLGNY